MRGVKAGVGGRCPPMLRPSPLLISRRELMTMRYIVLAGAAVLAAILPALAADMGGGPSAEQIIATRQAALDLSAGNFVAMVHDNKAGGAPKDDGLQAHALAKWAHVLPTLFPANTASGNTKARPEIWSNPTGFAKAAANYA